MLLYRSFVLLYYEVFLEIVAVNGGTVNISDTWFLPKQGLSLFYRYFSNKVTWDEANHICYSHGGNLIFPDNDEKMDSVQAYLKEIQTFGHVWLGLKKEVFDRSFLWMNGKPIKGDGLWLEPIPKANTRLCATIDPSADFRWVSFHCGGPETASFICELKAPQWAQNGCMVPELPSLLITFEPDIGVVQLISDCGLEGTRRITCKGRINREDVIKHLSCKENPYTDRSIADKVNYGTSQHSSMTNKESLTQATNALTWVPSRQTRHKRSIKPTYPVNTSHES